MKAPDDCTSMEEIRHAIDCIDRDIAYAMGLRFQYVKAIVKFKKNEDDVRAPERYNAVLRQRRAWATEVGLNPDVIERLYRDLIAYFIDEELNALHKNNAGHP